NGPGEARSGYVAVPAGTAKVQRVGQVQKKIKGTNIHQAGSEESMLQYLQHNITNKSLDAIKLWIYMV
ncbi:MAG: hypothetical protein ACR2PH_09540, partial [Desulfobulbia bacterium]